MCKILEKGLAGLAPRRRAAGFTQYSFAEALGVDRGLVAMYETGRDLGAEYRETSEGGLAKLF